MKSAPRLRHTHAMNSSTEVSAHERILAERVTLCKRRHLDPEARRLSRRRRARHRRRRTHLHRLRRRDRLPEHRPPVRARRRRDQGAGRRIPAPVLMVGIYEPYVEVCRRLAELSPCAGSEQKSLLLDSGAEAVENAVKIARSATGRPAVIVFDNAFHGRTLLTMTMTAKVKPYKAGFGPFAPEVYRATGAEPLPRDHHGRRDRRTEALFKADVDPATVACAVLEPVQGEGGSCRCRWAICCACRSSAASTGFSTSTTRCSPGSVAPGRCGRSSTTTALPGPARLAASRSAAACPRGRYRRGVDHGCRAARRLGGTFGGNPLACAAAIAVLDAVAEPAFLEQANTLGELLRSRLDALAGEARRDRRRARARPDAGVRARRAAPEQAAAIVAAAFERGCLLLASGCTAT